MPVKTSNYEDLSSDIDSIIIEDIFSAEVLSDDIWKKFELDLGDDLYNFDLDNFGLFGCNSDVLLNDNVEIRNHDCMWAGHCGSKEHSHDEPRLFTSMYQNYKTTITANNNTTTTTILSKDKKQTNIQPGRSLLLKQPVVISKQSTTQKIPSIESPPMTDDDEETKQTTSTLEILQEHISECDDSDLCEYFEDGEDIIKDPEDEEPKIQKSYQQRNYAIHSPANDHSYHKDKNASMRLPNFGMETPSDSEEEIDVVSVGDKYNTNGRTACTLPTNPSSKRLQRLQRTMASAISGKRISQTNPGGIRTLLPLRKSNQITTQQQQQDEYLTQPQQQQQQQQQRRGVKRPRISTGSMTRSPNTYKKRANCSNSSDSDEPEPSEKRNLHNNMERQRRIDLRNAFEDLRLLVPEVSKRERAAKVVILREAAVYCDHLGEYSDRLNRQVDDLRKKQEQLRGRVSQLRRTLASKHR